MNTKNEKVYCICCKKKVSMSDVQHGGAEISGMFQVHKKKRWRSYQKNQSTQGGKI